jgi:hypothetical protein
MIYFANPTNTRVRAAMASGRLGAIMSPAQGNRLPDGPLFCIDNNCGPTTTGQPGSKYPGDEAYLGYLLRLADAGHPDPCDPDRDVCMFAVAPDVLGDAAATLQRSQHMLTWIRHAGFRAALVAQNGLENLPVPWGDFDVLFLGGDTRWKLGPAARALTGQARRHHKWVHMGRVNSLQRLRYAAAIGCHSADGTYLTYAPDQNLPRLLGWLRDIHTQGSLFDLAGAA